MASHFIQSSYHYLCKPYKAPLNGLTSDCPSSSLHFIYSVCLKCLSPLDICIAASYFLHVLIESHLPKVKFHYLITLLSCFIFSP